MILDVRHMPQGCGTWPAFWEVGANWPFGGELDIIEGFVLVISHCRSGLTDFGQRERPQPKPELVAYVGQLHHDGNADDERVRAVPGARRVARLMLSLKDCDFQ